MARSKKLNSYLTVQDYDSAGGPAVKLRASRLFDRNYDVINLQKPAAKKLRDWLDRWLSEKRVTQKATNEKT